MAQSHGAHPNSVAVPCWMKGHYGTLPYVCMCSLFNCLSLSLPWELLVGRPSPVPCYILGPSTAFGQKVNSSNICGHHRSRRWLWPRWCGIFCPTALEARVFLQASGHNRGVGADAEGSGEICEAFRDCGSLGWFTPVPRCSMEKASEKRGLRNLCGCSHGKPQLREALGRGVCGEISSHPEAFGHTFHICWGLEFLMP